MTLKDLENKVEVRCYTTGTYRVVIKYRGKKYWCNSHNSLAWDRIYLRFDCHDNSVACSYTLKQAYLSLYDECKRLNCLGEYSY